MTGAARHLLYGIVIGMIFAVAVDQLVLAEIVINTSWDAMAPTMLLIGASQSMLVLVIFQVAQGQLDLQQHAVWMDVWIGHGGDAGRVHHSEDIRSRYMGWVFWFGIGALLMGAVVSATCALAVASISGWQGTKLLQSYRLVPTIISTVMRAMVIASVTLSVFEPWRF